MTTISASVVLQTRNPRRNKILTTFLLRYPRFIHSEFMTHRVFSRNAASSRAISVDKLIADVMENPAVPLHWGKNQRGMQAHETTDALVVSAGEELTNERAWLRARDNAVEMARAFSAAGYHKQVVNRLLEPFAHITVVASATELSNFFALRTHADAEPHFQMLANEMLRVKTEAVPEEREVHAPFTDLEEHLTLDELVRVSVARCASTSYKTVDGFDMDVRRATEIFEKLSRSDPIHASPFEHVAVPDTTHVFNTRWRHRPQHGNFVGFRQLRHMPGLSLE